jgi:tetratricopeptide (TPR) repeat protein
MRKFSSAAAVTVATVVLAMGVAGCSQVNMLKAKMAFKDANALYQGQDYKAAAEKYEEAVTLDPSLGDAFFFLGNSYDNMYRPTKRGDAANDGYLTKAIDYYKKSAESASDPKIKKLSLEYLVAAYGPDKLNDPTQSEPILQRMIELDPKEPSNYFVLGKIYEDNGDYERAEQTYMKAREMKPNDPAVYMTLAGFYNRQGEFDKTMEALKARAEQEPNNPEAYYTMATFYWEKAYRDFTTPEPQKVQYVQSGLQSVDKALQLKPDYFEALTYKNLLLRVQANLEKNPQVQQRLLREADQFRDKAQEIRNKQRASGAGE